MSHLLRFIVIGLVTLLPTQALDTQAAPPAWTFEGDQDVAQLGTVAGAGDVNGDGYADFVVGARSYDNVFINQGRAFLFLGSPTGPSVVPDWIAEGDQTDAFFGASVSSAGDVNGDGFDDVMIGAPGYISPPGGAFLYLGSAGGLSATPSWTATETTPDDCFGYVDPAGDVNGDGYDDVLVRNPCDEAVFLYAGTPAGLTAIPVWAGSSGGLAINYAVSAAGAGDIDGDGFDDILVGADDWFPDLDPGSYSGSSLGKVFLYRGSASGPSPSPSLILEGEQPFAYFGFAVAGAGDVNGDGYDDFLVGAHCYSNPLGCEGQASLYLGSASSPISSPAWTAEGELENARFGVTLASAGDVNDDGFADVIVGATQYFATPDTGQVFLYLGSPSGLSPLSAWDSAGQSSSSYGGSIATAGDVDSDGFDDILIGAAGYDNGESNEGAAFLFLGADLCLDLDHDGYGSPGRASCAAGAQTDCNDGDGEAWSEPSTTDSLQLGQATDTTMLTWVAPSQPGALSLRYDTLRSDLPGDFLGSTVCLEWDEADTLTTDAELPAAGTVWHYLVRVENDCPRSAGTMGSDSQGVPRTGLACP